MKVCTFEEVATGLVVGDRVVGASAAAEQAGIALESASTEELLGLSDAGRARLLAAATSMAETHGRPLTALSLGPPVLKPDKIICVQNNYHDRLNFLSHPGSPVLVSKDPGSLVGHRGDVVLPEGGHDIDYEAALAVVIGRGGRDISIADALGHVAGYVPFNDVIARDLQDETPLGTAGRSIETFGPCGPYVTTADEVADPHRLAIRSRVNGRTIQNATTADMIFSIPEQIAFISTKMELLPGDIIATGTPAGVGFTRQLPVSLEAGDLVEVEIEGLATLANTIAAAPARAAVGTSVQSPVPA